MFLIFNLDWNLGEFPPASSGDYQRLVITCLISVGRHKNQWQCEMLHWLAALRELALCLQRWDRAWRPLAQPQAWGVGLNPSQRTPRAFQVPSFPFLELLMSLLEERVKKSMIHWQVCCSVTKSCSTLCDPMDCSTPGSSVLHHLPEFAQIHIHWVGDAIKPSHPLLPPSPFAFNLFRCQGLFPQVSSLHRVAKVLKLQPQHQSCNEDSGLISLKAHRIIQDNLPHL